MFVLMVIVAYVVRDATFIEGCNAARVVNSGHSQAEGDSVCGRGCSDVDAVGGDRYCVRRVCIDGDDCWLLVEWSAVRRGG